MAAPLPLGFRLLRVHDVLAELDDRPADPAA